MSILRYTNYDTITQFRNYCNKTEGNNIEGLPDGGIMMLNLHLLDIEVLKSDFYFSIYLYEEDNNERWNYHYWLTFKYSEYTTKLLDMYPSSDITKVLEKIPFTKNDTIDKTKREGGRKLCNLDKYRSYDSFLSNINMDGILPVYSDGHYYFLNMEQTIEFERISNESDCYD